MSEPTARVTVYGKPQCVQCDMTKLALAKKCISYNEVELTISAAALEYVQDELGYSAAPVVVDNADEHNHWAGFRPDKIDALVA